MGDHSAVRGSAHPRTGICLHFRVDMFVRVQSSVFARVRVGIVNVCTRADVCARVGRACIAQDSNVHKRLRVARFPCFTRLCNRK